MSSLWFLDTQNGFYFIAKGLKNAFLMHFLSFFLANLGILWWCQIWGQMYPLIFLADRNGGGEGCQPLRSASKFPVFVFDPFPKNTRKYYENIKEQSAITPLPPSKFTKKSLGQNSFVQFCRGWGTIPFNTCRKVNTCWKVPNSEDDAR